MKKIFVVEQKGKAMDDLISRAEAINAIWDGINMDIYTK